MDPTMGDLDCWLRSVHAPNDRRPWVTLCYAESLDGAIAVRRGVPTLLSGPPAMMLTHRLRAAHDAILVGVGTVLSDNPQLTVRLVEGENPQPVVLDSRLRTPVEAAVLRHSRSPWIATTPAADASRRAALEAAGAQLLFLPADRMGRVDLNALLKLLLGMQVQRLMVEGGAQVITAFLQARQVDGVVLTLAPRFLGGLRAVEMPLMPPPALRDPRGMVLGDNWVIWGAMEGG